MSKVYVKWKPPSNGDGEEVVLEVRLCQDSWTNEDRPGCRRLTACHTTDRFEMEGREFSCEIDETDKEELMKNPIHPKGFKFFYTEELARYSKGCCGGRYLIGIGTISELFDPNGRLLNVIRETTGGNKIIEEYVNGIISSASRFKSGRYYGSQTIYFKPTTLDENVDPGVKSRTTYDEEGEKIEMIEYYPNGIVKTHQTGKLSIFNDESGFPSVIITNDRNMLTDISNSTIYYFDDGKLSCVDVIRNNRKQFLKRLNLIFRRKTVQKSLLRKVSLLIS